MSKNQEKKYVTEYWSPRSLNRRTEKIKLFSKDTIIGLERIINASGKNNKIKEEDLKELLKTIFPGRIEIVNETEQYIRAHRKQEIKRTKRLRFSKLLSSLERYFQKRVKNNVEESNIDDLFLPK